MTFFFTHRFVHCRGSIQRYFEIACATDPELFHPDAIGAAH
jgi:hypothetical protein